MCKEQLVIFSSHELIFEAQSEVCFDALTRPIVIVKKSIVVIEIFFHLFGFLLHILPLDVVLDVRNVVTASEPASAVCIKLSLGPNAWLHAHLVQAGSLGQVEDRKFYLLAFFIWMQCYILVNYFKIIPLSMALRV